MQRYTAQGWKSIAYPTTLSYTATGLTNGVTYAFRILAHNAAGWGPVSTVVSAVPFTAPSAPSKCTAVQWYAVEQGLLIEWWDAPSDGGSPALFVEVRGRTADSLDGGGDNPWQV